MDKNFIGRKEELQMLKDIKSSGKAEFVAVYGRRRVGKTYLSMSLLPKRTER
ncbi:MAG: ATP-binding protein [Prevotella sp.]|nr:ATP-binding protein [Prevotella sp.]